MKNYFPNHKSILGAFAVSSIALSLGGCLEEDDTSNSLALSKYYGVVTTADSTGSESSGNISIISLEDFSTANSVIPTGGSPDTSISTNGSSIYLIQRLPQSSITNITPEFPEIESGATPTLEDVNTVEFTVGKEFSVEEGSNPHKLVVKDDNTAYVIRYGTDKIWIVNPSAQNSTDYKVDEIDLSDYAGTDGIAEATDAVLIENKLYVLIQNLDRDNSWTPGTAYIAIFNTIDNSEIETNTISTSPKGIALKTTNPSKMDFLSTNNTIYVSSVGPYYPQDFTGGIEGINATNYTTQIIVDDGDVNTHPYGQINNVAILNSTRGYFVGYSAWKDTAVYSFNPATGEVDTMPLIENIDISDIEVGPLGNLWVTNRDESGITIFNTVDNTVSKALIDTDNVPNDIEFISLPIEN